MGVDLYPEIVHQANISSDSFGSEIDTACEEIHLACKGFGTNEM